MIPDTISIPVLALSAEKKSREGPAIGPQLIGTVTSATISSSLEGPRQRLPNAIVTGFNRSAITQAHIALSEERDMPAQTPIPPARPG
jgi:hypothetical protein